MNLLYEIIYHIMRVLRVPNAWVFGDKRALLDEMLESGRIAPGRAIDLGCGAGAESVYLAGKGFAVTGVDRSPTAIELARGSAEAAGVEVNFVQDDLTNLRHTAGTFDLLVDFGVLNDLNQAQRELYMSNLLPLTRPGSRYLLMGFENKLSPEEIEHRFREHFTIETVSRQTESLFRRVIAVYLMTRKGKN
jgi:2-polyprenyl-3-methyl-5-hydroxy-6-metoxy-1,4-benzoquinol methylase